MSYQNLGFAFSLLLHLLFLPLLFYINKPISQESKTIALDFELNNIIITGEQDADTKTMNITEEAKEEEPNPVVEAQEIKNAAEEEPPPEKVTEIVKEDEPNPVVEVQEIKSVVEEEPPPENVVEIIKEEKPNPVYAKRVTKQVVT